MNRFIYISTYEGNTLLFKSTTVCLLEDDFLSYNTDNENIRINLKDFTLTKENSESKLRLTKEKCTLTLKENHTSFDIPITYINYKNENNKIEIEYQLISQEYPLKLMIEIGEENNEV